MVSKTIRFEVFKRDAFTCQYCGKTPPTIVLELDHINPKSNNGKDDISNLITACFECNRGKGKRLLSTAPEAITKQLKELKIKREQLIKYQKFLKDQDLQTNKAIKRIEKVYTKASNDQWLFADRFKPTVKTLLNKLPEIKIIHAMELACLKLPPLTDKEGNDTLSYFCGICWNWIKNPKTRDW